MTGDCEECGGPTDEDGNSTADCAAGRYDDYGCCTECGGCICDGSC